ncbi:MAG: T9SS type A sorting domain-containing protein [Bacteroidota bacterium]
MKKLYLSLVFVLSMAFSMQAQVIVSEDFDYTAGSGLEGANGGSGWNGAWQLVDGVDQMILGDTIENYRTGVGSTSYFQFNIPETDSINVRYQRVLNTEITDDGSEYWLAFNLEIEESGANVTNLLLGDTTTGQGLKFLFGRLFDGNLAVGAFGGTLVRANGVEANRPNWLVSKINFTGDDASDTIRLFINPDRAVMPSNEDAVATFIGGKLNGGGKINAITIRAEAADPADPPIVANYDDIFLGRTFADVIPTNTVEVPVYSPVSESFNYTAGAGLDGQGTAGDGWADPWSLLTGPDQVISSDSIANPELLFNTAGNSLQIDAALGLTRMSRRLTNRYVDHGENYWFGFNVNFMNADADGGELVMILADTTFAAGGPAGQAVSFGKINSSDSLGILSFGNPFGSVVAQDGANGSYWMVAKLEMSGDADADTIRLFINPSTTGEPAIGTEVAKFTTTKLNGGFQAIGFKNGGGITQALVDDFYLALDFEDIVPADIETFEVPDVAFEQFNYTAGDSLDTKGSAENGWAGPWTQLSGSDQPIVEGGIQNSTLLKQTSGNSLFLDARSGTTRFKRELATPYLDNGSTYWFAFHAEFDSAGVEGDAGEMVVMLVDNDSEEFGAGGGNGQFVAIGRTNEPGALGVLSFGPFGKQEVENVADDAVWLVAKIETNGTDDADSVRLYINPDPSQEPAPGSEAVVFAAPELNGGFQGVGFKFTAGATKARVDDIFLGSFFTDIVPDDLGALANPDPAFEKFEYTAGGNLEMNGDESNGWAGPWEKLGGDADATIASGGVTNTTVFTRTTGNSLTLDARDGALRYVRPLASNYDDNGLTYWLGFHVAFDSTTEDNGVVNVMLVNNESETFGASGGNGQFVAIGKSNAPDALGVLSFGPFGKVEVPDQSADGEFWLVARIETNGTAEADSVRLYINPSPGTTPALGSEVAVFAASELNGGFRGIGFKQDAGATKTQIDDIYVGNSFDEITPPDLEDVEDLFTAGETFDSFNYTVGEDLNGKGMRADGWGGPWMTTSGAITIEEGNIETEFALFEGNKALANFASEAIQYDRALSATFSDDSSQVWISFLMDVRSATDINAEARLVIMDGDTELVGFGRVAGFNSYGITSTPTDEITNIDSDGEAWFLARIDFSNSGGPETIRLWINYGVPEIQPADNTADIIIEPNASNAIAMNNGFDKIRIEGSGTAGVEFAIDEIRLGYNYSDVSKIEEVIPDNLIARDQFRYPAGAALNGLGAGGTQWGGSWEIADNGGGPATIEEGNVSVSGISGLDNKVNLTSDGSVNSRYIRPLATPVTDDGNGYWLSFLSDIDVVGGGVAQGGFSVGSQPTVIFGKKFGPTNISIIDLAGNSAVQTIDTDTEASENSWFVVYVQFSGDESEDSAWLWLNPDPNSEPSQDDADAVISTDKLNDGIDHIFFRAEGATEGGNATESINYRVDEVHFGTTFESVVPVGADPGNGGGDPTFVKEELLSLKVYPNPASSQLTFESNIEKPGFHKLSLINLAGAEVATIFAGEIRDKNVKISESLNNDKLGSIQNGFYLIKWESAGGMFTRRILIQK